jgi:26S proteasome regulatory subunit T1
MTPTQISDFLDGAIRSRISVRLIAEQHIALSQAIQSPYPPTNNVGVVDMYCSPAKTIKSCGFFVSELCNATLGDSPTIVVDGHADTTFA